MSLTWQTPGAASYSTAGGTSVSPAYPAGSAEGDKLVLLVGQKPATANGGGVTTPAGWNLVAAANNASPGDTGGYTTTLGVDTGNTNLYAYERTVPAGGLSGSLAVTVSDNNVCWAKIYRISKGGAAWIGVSGAVGKDTTAGTSVSIAFGSDPGVAPGDLVIGAMCIPTDVTTPAQFSAMAFSQTGITFGTVTEDSEPDSSVGNDIGGFICRATASSGVSSAAPTMTATAGGTTTNVRGPGVFVRVREELPALVQTARFDNVNTFYQHAIDLNLLQSARFDNQNTFYSHSIVSALIQAARFDNVNTFFEHVLVGGDLFLDQSARFDNANTFFTHSINQDGVAIELWFEGTDGSTTFTDKSAFNHTPLAVGGNAQIDTANKKYGTAALLLDGTGDYLAYQSDLFRLAPGQPFTVRLWFFRDDITYGDSKSIFELGPSLFPGVIDNVLIVDVTSGDQIVLYLNNTGGPTDGYVTKGVWQHLEIDYDGTYLYTFLNGQGIFAGSVSLNNGSEFDTLTIGGAYSLAYLWNGAIDDFQYIKGAALHTSNFTPPGALESNWLTQSARFDNAQTWYQHTISVAEILVQSARFDNSNSVSYAHVLTPGTVTLTQSARFNNSATLNLQHALSTSIGLSQTVSFTNTSSYYQHALQASNALAQSSIYNNSNALAYQHTVTPGTVTLTQAARFDNSNSLTYAHTLNQSAGVQTLSQAARFDSSNSLAYTHTLTTSVALSQSSRFDNGNILNYLHTLSASSFLTQSARFDSVNTLSYGHTLALGGAVLTQTLRLDSSNTLNFQHTLSAVNELTQSVRFTNTASYYQHAVQAVIALGQNSIYANSNNLAYQHTINQWGAPQSLTQMASYNTTSNYYSHTLTSANALSQSTRFDNSNSWYQHILAGALVWPAVTDVRLGVYYGPTGVEYVGTYVDTAPKLELETSRIFKPLTEKVGILL